VKAVGEDFLKAGYALEGGRCVVCGKWVNASQGALYREVGEGRRRAYLHPECWEEFVRGLSYALDLCLR